MAKSKKVVINRDDQDSLILQKFGENLRKIREKAELSQEQVAYESGFSRSYYTEVETGKRNISLLNILKICSFLKIEINDIIKLKDFSNK
jgi:transcriptional regulator with XRE-family HTH domain